MNACQPDTTCFKCAAAAYFLCQFPGYFYSIWLLFWKVHITPYQRPSEQKSVYFQMNGCVIFRAAPPTDQPSPPLPVFCKSILSIWLWTTYKVCLQNKNNTRFIICTCLFSMMQWNVRFEDFNSEQIIVHVLYAETRLVWLNWLIDPKS